MTGVNSTYNFDFCADHEFVAKQGRLNPYEVKYKLKQMI